MAPNPASFLAATGCYTPTVPVVHLSIVRLHTRDFSLAIKELSFPGILSLLPWDLMLSIIY